MQCFVVDFTIDSRLVYCAGSAPSAAALSVASAAAIRPALAPMPHAVDPPSAGAAADQEATGKAPRRSPEAGSSQSRARRW